MSNCTFCKKPKPDDGMRLCAECAQLADDALDEIGFDPEAILDELTKDWPR